MDEMYRMLGRERENDLIREAERLHRGARVRKTRHEQRTLVRALPMTVGAMREHLRSTLRRIAPTLRLVRGSR